MVLIKIDMRESALIKLIQQKEPKLEIQIQSLPLGDVIICDNTDTSKIEESVIIERKSISDLLSSIKDGRYEEQSYRLNGLDHHNHNIVYLVEGAVRGSDMEKKMAYSAMFSLNYYKGFSVFRSFSLDESACIICNMATKFQAELNKKEKTPFYKNKKIESTIMDKKEPSDNDNKEKTNENEEKLEVDSQEVKIDEQEEKTDSQEVDNQEVKNYVHVIKKVKKENITPENIGEIMLSQVPGISSIIACVLMAKYKSIGQLIKELEQNRDCLSGLTYTTPQGQVRKVNKSALASIAQYLIK